MTPKPIYILILVMILSLLLLGAAPSPAAAPPSGAAASAPAANAPAPPAPPAPPTPRAERHVFYLSPGSSWLGVSIADIDAQRAGELGLKEERGAEIKAVVSGGPAEAAGLRKGDVLLQYGDARIESVSQVTRLVEETPIGRTVTVRYLRGGTQGTAQVKVSEREGPTRMHDIIKRIEIPDIEIPDIELPDLDFDLPVIALEGIPSTLRLGASIETLTPQLGGYFGAPDGKGVLVRSVSKGSSGEKAGLKAGDVILEVDDERIVDASDLRGALRGRRGSDIRLTILRDRRQQTLKVAAPEEGRSGRHGGRIHVPAPAGPGPAADGATSL